MVGVRIATRGLVEDPRGAKHSLSRGLVFGRIAKEAGLDVVRAENPLHARVWIHQQSANQRPVARLVEHHEAVCTRRDTEAIERNPALRGLGNTSGIANEVRQVRVAAGAMAAMARMRAPVRTGQIAHHQRVATGVLDGDDLRRTSNRCEQSRRPKACIVDPKSDKALTAVGERLGSMQMATICGSNGDGLSDRWDATRASHHTKQDDRGETANHCLQDSPCFRLTSQTRYATLD